MPVRHTVPLEPHDPPSNPSIETLAALQPVAWHPQRNICVAQDTIVGPARRPVASFGLAGRRTWPWDEAGAVANYPNYEDWRVAFASTDVRLTPGNYLRLRFLFVPSGQTREPLTATAAFADGWVRVTVTWANGASSSGPHNFAFQLLATDPDGDLPTDAGELWGELYEGEIVGIFPPDADSDTSVSETYSEGTTATMQLEIRGGARIVDALLYEYPLRHTTDHDETAARSVHAAWQSGGPPLVQMTPVPQTERRDGAVYDDRRYGSHQLLRVAAQQAAVLGPRVASWTAWESDQGAYSDTNSLGETDLEPWTVTGSTNPISLLTGSTSGYNPTEPGWVVSGSHAQLHRYCETHQIMRDGSRAVIPVRVSVRGRWTGAGTSGIWRFQSSDTEWVDVEFTNSGTTQTLSVIGFLESQTAADHETAVLQIFGIIDDAADDLYIYSWGIDFGWTGAP